MPTTTITFNGLLVFRPDPDNNLCEVGVLRARGEAHPHILQIQVTPNPQTGTGTWRLNPDDLEAHVQAKNVAWNLDVELNGQAIQGPLTAKIDIPADRLNPTANNTDDFGWIVNVESGEFHSSKLARLKNRLLPVIKLTKGRLFTSCKTDSVAVRQGANSRPNFGFIAGAIGLSIDTSAGEEPVLYFVNSKGVRTEIFRLIQSNQRNYAVSIRNTPTAGTAGGHFHLFYDRLFTRVGQAFRFDILRRRQTIMPPNGRCPVGADPDPDPFKCGGVSVGTGSGSLGS